MDLAPERTALTSCSTIKHQSIQNVKSKNSLKDFIIWNLLLICLLIFVGPICLYITYRMPKSKSMNVSLDQFSEERVLNYLSELTLIGPRVSYTYENLQAKNYILSQIERICSMNKRNIECEIDIQTFTNIYSYKLENLLVRISNSTKENSLSLLLTAHYDSVEFSSGISDDGSGISILLELLTNILNDNLISFEKMNLIILFTNGEEIGPEGVLAFVNKHIWSLNIIRFIYLDSINCQDKSSLIQIKSSKLLIDYSSVKRPSANLLFEYLPQLIGITSDYDIYSLNSSIQGYNFGYYLDGYYYHSLLDNNQRIKQGIFQELGDNLQELIRKIFNNENSNEINQNEEMIYFDIFGRYLISYRLTISNLIEFILIILIILINSCLIIIDNKFNHEYCQNKYCLYKYFQNVICLRLLTIIIYFLSHLISIIFSLIFSLIISWILSKFRPLSFYGNVTLTIFLFSFPCLILFLIIYFIFKKFHRKILINYWPRKCSINLKFFEELTFNYEENLSILLIFSFLMLISIIFSNRLFYLILIWSIFICPINICLILIEFLIDWNILRINSMKLLWFIFPLISLIFPLIHTIEILIRILRMIIPFVCRGFSLKKYLSENEILSGLISIVNILFILILIPIIYRSKQLIRTICFLLIGLIIIFVIIFIREPYSNQYPKIFYAKHTSKSIYTVLKLSERNYQVPIVSQISLITMMTFDNLPLEPILEEFSMKTNFDLLNLKCSDENKCTFNDSFNRTLPIQNIEILNKFNSSKYLIIQLKHLSIFNIQISSRSNIQISIENQTILPRNFTRIHIKFNSNLTLFDLNIDIKRCQLIDSPFLLLFNRFMPQMLLTGDSYCHSITDLTTLLFDMKYII